MHSAHPFHLKRQRSQFLRVASKSEFLPREMPLPNLVHVDMVSKHQLAITANYIGFAMNERQKLVSVACMSPGKCNSCVRTSYRVFKMFLHTGSAIRTLIN